MRELFKKRRTTLLVLLAVAGLLNSEISQALVVLKDADEPFPVTLETTVDAKTAQYGDPFKATVADDIQYEGGLIPRGTVLSGQVVHFQRESYRLNFPGWVEMSIQQADFPGGETVTFNKPDEVKVYDPKARKFSSYVKSTAPLWAVSLGTSIPLRIATDLNGGVVTAIATGARTVAGVVHEFVTKDEDDVLRENPAQFQTTKSRIGYGALRGVGAVGLYRASRKYPEPNLAPGTTMEIRLNDDEMEQLFAHHDAVVPETLNNLQQ